MFNPSKGGSKVVNDIKSDKTVNKILEFIDEERFDGITRTVVIGKKRLKVSNVMQKYFSNQSLKTFLHKVIQYFFRKQ